MLKHDYGIVEISKQKMVGFTKWQKKKKKKKLSCIDDSKSEMMLNLVNSLCMWMFWRALTVAVSSVLIPIPAIPKSNLKRTCFINEAAFKSWFLVGPSS